MIPVDEKLLLHLHFKLNKSLSSGLYDYSLKKSDVYSFNTGIEDTTYIIMKGATDILRVERQADIEAKRMEKLLFKVKKEENFNYILESPSAINFSEYNTESLNNKLWFTINHYLNSENLNQQLFINKDYYLCENDVLKFGNIKYIVKQISINSIKVQKEIREINFDFCPSIQTYYTSEEQLDKTKNILCKVCEKSICSEENPLIKFCSCNYIHFECVKNNITLYTRHNENVKNYYIDHLKCKATKI